jgi:putative DNA primase/helicase
MTEATAIIASLEQRMKQVADSAEIRIKKLLNERDHCTDLGNAVRLINKYGEHIRYSAEMGKWLIWTGQKWEADKSQRIRTMAFDTIRSIYHEASELESKKERNELVDWAVQSESASRISAMISLAQALVPVTADQLDTHQDLFNIANGVLDLQTDELYPHDPAFLLTKMAPVAYKPDAGCPTWLAFLNRIMDGNDQLIEFLQRAVGYSMTGLTSEHVLFFLHGTGANGKSTFLNTLMALYGDYAKPTDPDLLLAKQGEAHPTGVAGLMGARMAITNEVEDGRRLAENLVKQLTGGDRLTARFMRQDFFSFDPTHKLWMAGNHKPIIRGQDEGIWRRIRLVPFAVTIPPEERDKHLDEKLRRELPGILRWAVEGAKKWREGGLTYPDEVKAAVDQYRNEQDALSGFLDEECVISATVRAAKPQLYRCYVEWCEENGQRPYSQRRLTQAIEQRFNVYEQKSGSVRYLVGIGLIN